MLTMKKLGFILIFLTLTIGCKQNKPETKNPVEVVKEQSKIVFGCYPYDKKDLYKQLDLTSLTDVAYFSYEVNSVDGSPLTIHDWKTTALIDTLKTNNIRSYLAVTNSGITNNKKFLTNNFAINTLITKTIELIVLRNADGVCIIFEEVLKSDKANYTAFITLLSQKLKQHNNNYRLNMIVPYIDTNRSLDFEALIPFVDQFVIFETDTKLKETSNHTSSIEYYLANKIPSSKLTVAKPL